MGRSSSRAPTEIAQVVPYGDVREPSLPEKADLEGGVIEEHVHRRASTSSSKSPEARGAPLVLENTPFFHFDVVSAVRAAESGLLRPSASVDSMDSGKRVDRSA